MGFPYLHGKGMKAWFLISKESTSTTSNVTALDLLVATSPSTQSLKNSKISKHVTACQDRHHFVKIFMPNHFAAAKRPERSWKTFGGFSRFVALVCNTTYVHHVSMRARKYIELHWHAHANIQYHATPDHTLPYPTLPALLALPYRTYLFTHITLHYIALHYITSHHIRLQHIIFHVIWCAWMYAPHICINICVYICP